MRVLLDTHVALWLLGDGVHELADDLVERLADPATDVQLSAASVWEVEIKRGLGKLTVDADIVEAGEAAGLAALPISHQHAVVAGRLPRHHADPFDRMLVAQAQLEDLTLVTRDPALQAYDVPILLA